LTFLQNQKAIIDPDDKATYSTPFTNKLFSCQRVIHNKFLWWTKKIFYGEPNVSS